MAKFNTNRYLRDEQPRRAFNPLDKAGPIYQAASITSHYDCSGNIGAIDTVMLPRRRGSSLTYHAVAYDAGSENNNQECAYVPGPACPEGSGNARDESGAEGFVYIHNGVHQTGDLSPTRNDWHNPVAKVVITRLR